MPKVETNSPTSLRVAEKIAEAGGRKLGDEVPLSTLPFLVSGFPNLQRMFEEIAYIRRL